MITITVVRPAPNPVLKPLRRSTKTPLFKPQATQPAEQSGGSFDTNKVFVITSRTSIAEQQKKSRRQKKIRRVRSPSTR